MSKKDYKAIAAILAGEFACATPSEKLVIWRTTLSIAHVFKQDNIRFSFDKFYEAVFGDSDHFAVRDRFSKPVASNRPSPHNGWS